MMSRRQRPAPFLLLSVLIAGGSAPAQDGAKPVFPKDKSAEEAKNPPPPPTAAPEPQPAEAPEVEVTAKRLKEEDPVGPYHQPEWTTHRRFPGTRVYIQTPPGASEFEQWIEVRMKKDRQEPTETRLRQEFAFGIGERVQLDLYMNEEHVTDNQDSEFKWRGWSAEGRWALADWGKIFGNPTLYFEYLFFDGAPDKIEPKLLFGGEIAPRWHWGANLIYERELAGQHDRDEELAATAAASYAIIDRKVSLGAELTFSYEAEKESGVDTERTREVLLGPSLQWRPLERVHIDVAPLWGLTGESKRMKMFIVFGWDF